MMMLDLHSSRSENSCMTSVNEIAGKVVNFEASRVRTLSSRTPKFSRRSVISLEKLSNLEDKLSSRDFKLLSSFLFCAIESLNDLRMSVIL